MIFHIKSESLFIKEIYNDPWAVSPEDLPPGPRPNNSEYHDRGHTLQHTQP